MDSAGQFEGLQEFKPCAQYEAGLDILCYVSEDVSYRMDQSMRLGTFLRILWHPHEERIIGFQLYGFANLLTGAFREEMVERGLVPLRHVLEEAYAHERRGTARDAIRDVLRRFPDAQIRFDRCPQIPS